MFQAVVPVAVGLVQMLQTPRASHWLVALLHGFDFADFEMGNREKLLTRFPQHKNIIEMLTHV
ncbi:MAG: hypothetical protein R3C26_11970 [Calditrichia bacterium]